MTLVAGIDSSTQSCKVLVCEAESGRVVREARAAHPDATEVDPARWWQAWTTASSGLLDGVRALAVAGQQHGLVVTDADGDVVRPALLWNDTRSAQSAQELVAEFGGPWAWAQAVGSVPVASFTVSKLRWVAEHEPALASRITRALLPHDWMTWCLLGRTAEPVTDRGDASGTGYWSPAHNAYRTDVLKLAFGREVSVPRVAAPAEVIGELPSGAIVAAGTGDNMGAALGLGADDGDVIVSLGTSGTVFAVYDHAVADATGAVAGFADASGKFLPLVCTLNAARVLTAAATMLGTDLTGLDRLALEAEPGAEGLVLLPYLDGERTPNLPHAAGSLHGLRRHTMTPENLARAAVEGMLCGLADGLDALRRVGVTVRRILLIGGGARSAAVRAVAPTVFGAPVHVPAPGEYVALGAARQAAWVLSGATTPPAWRAETSSVIDTGEEGAGAAVRARYAAARSALHPT